MPITKYLSYSILWLLLSSHAQAADHLLALHYACTTIREELPVHSVTGSADEALITAYKALHKEVMTSLTPLSPSESLELRQAWNALCTTFAAYVPLIKGTSYRYVQGALFNSSTTTGQDIFAHAAEDLLRKARTANNALSVEIITTFLLLPKEDIRRFATWLSEIMEKTIRSELPAIHKNLEHAPPGNMSMDTLFTIFNIEALRTYRSAQAYLARIVSAFCFKPSLATLALTRLTNADTRILDVMYDLFIFKRAELHDALFAPKLRYKLVYCEAGIRPPDGPISDEQIYLRSFYTFFGNLTPLP